MRPAPPAAVNIGHVYRYDPAPGTHEEAEGAIVLARDKADARRRLAGALGDKVETGRITRLTRRSKMRLDGVAILERWNGLRRRRR